ncbi:MAG TPA: hypothetical protein VM345_03070 [Acidimicrobiales bacterium]|nr:hypothetical protein [Acidimicrobiales bacterium]
MTDTTTTELRGDLRTPRNGAQGIKGSIHDDATAQKLGLRGGTVAGSVHLDVLVPLALELFGPRWFETGSVSMAFKNATVDAEPVRGIAARPTGGSDQHVAARIEREDGLLVAEGTLGIGSPAQPSALRALDHNRFANGELRILDGVRAGDAIPPKEITIDGERQERLVATDGIVDPLDWYAGESPWGGPVASMQTAVHHLYTFAANHIGSQTVSTRGGGVGLFGCIEVAHLAGPLFLDRTYSMAGVVLGVGQSPKTEYVWFETTATDDTGAAVASMVMQLRWMKASSPLYAS